MGCHSTFESSWHMATIGLTVIASVLIQGSIYQGEPLEQLEVSGKRPKGRGLFDWILNHYKGGGSVGVIGYDPVQGAFAPPLRLRMHMGCICLLWSVFLFFWPSFLFENKCYAFQLSRHFFMAGQCAIALYLALFFVLYHVLPGVSTPGGPRKFKIDRHPKWKDKEHTHELLAKYAFATGKSSHENTIKRFAGTACALTGEPAGRDIWTEGSEKPKVDEKLVQELASSGRDGAFNPSKNPNSCDVPFRAQMIRQYLAKGGKPPSKEPAKTVEQVLEKAVSFYGMLQTDDGHWSGDYGGPLFLMPGLVVAWYVMGKSSLMLDQEQIELMKFYIITHQQVDGGWGTHIESPSTMFGTTLSYVALRLMGMPADDPVCEQGRKFIRDQGGATMTSSWAKFYLCLLGCMDWDGHNSVPPEMWLLPNWFPFHPGRMWCHARMVYLPMGYLYGSRFVYEKAETDPLILALRKELYVEDYSSIDWTSTRHLVAAMDNYSPLPWTMRIAQDFLALYESLPLFQPLKNAIRNRGLAFSLDYMKAEDLQTNFIDIGPVNKVLNMISMYHSTGDIHHSLVVNHLARVQDYMWVAEDGMKMKGYNGSQCWDTSFAIQAIYEAGLLDKFPTVSRKVWSYLERCQILSTEVSQATPAFKYESAENRRKYYRHLSEGGWPFSTSAHGWPITDCTGEGLKGVLCLKKSKTVQTGVQNKELLPISDERLFKSIEVLLTYQNEDGGFATYENNRGFGWYESLNPSEVFGDIMIDYSYVECSMASLTALAEFHHDFPNHRTDEVKHALEKGREFLKSIQREDGSWYGSWACCFCYACWFGIEGLIKCGEPLDSECITSACAFLIKNQRPNGGWGEDFTSCYDKDYAKNGMEAYGDDGSGVVNTGWALMALSMAKCKDVDAIRRGIAYLKRRQLPSGDWPQEGISGVFNRSCGITYTAYRNVFPIWALGRCKSVYGESLDE